MATRFREEAPERHATPDASVEPALFLRQATFERTEREARFVRQRLERHSFTRQIQRADVACFVGVTGFLSFEPTQGQPLRPADIRTMPVNTALRVRAEKCAAIFRMRRPLLEQACVVAFDHSGFDFENREPVSAACGAALLAIQAFAVSASDWRTDLVDDVVQALDPVDHRIVDRQRGHVGDLR